MMKLRYPMLIGILGLLAIMCLCGIANAASQPFAPILSFQGRLCTPDGKPLPDGPYHVIFSIYDESIEGNRFWQEEQEIRQIGGIFSTHLGTVTPLELEMFSRYELWLGIQVGHDPEMPQRIHLVPSPRAIYSLESFHAASANEANTANSATNATNAGNANTVDGIHAASTATPNYLLPLDGTGKWPLTTIPQGPASGLNADLLDGLHAIDFWTKAEGGEFVALTPTSPQANAAVSLTGDVSAPTVTLSNPQIALVARTTDTGSMTWVYTAPPSSTTARAGMGMAYVSSADRAVSFGGAYPVGYINYTFAYDVNSNAWENRSPSTAPSVRGYMAMAYDSESDMIIMFGGYNGTSELNDTWVYNYSANTWTNMNPTNPPSPRMYCKMAYDAESDRMILFGGISGGAYMADTWAYNYNTNTWTMMTPPSQPPYRCGAMTAYDEKHDRVILYGGHDATIAFADTWAYDYNTNSWTSRAPAVAPTARTRGAMVYDTNGECCVLFGGMTFGGARFGDTWMYDYRANTWTQTSPAGSPSARMESGLAYDSESNRVVLYGGLESGGYRNDTWIYHTASLVARFEGGVRISGNLMVSGSKNAIVETPSYGERKVYCQESTEVWFEHIGSAELRDGKAIVQLNPIFLETVTIDDDHPMLVFVTPTSDIDRYYVVKAKDSFTVVSKSNRTGTFDYRVVAKRRGFETDILEPTDVIGGDD